MMQVVVLRIVGKDEHTHVGVGHGVARAISAHTHVYIIIKCRFCIEKVALCICKVALCDDNVALLYKSGGTSEIKISELILYFTRFALTLCLH